MSSGKPSKHFPCTVSISFILIIVSNPVFYCFGGILSINRPVDALQFQHGV